jgi:hypothetical protein
VNADPPAVRDDGLILVITGEGLVIMKASALETPPPGKGLSTVTIAVPGVTMSDAAIDAINRVEEIKVVARPDPFQRTTEPLTKLLPSTVSEKAEPPAAVDAGLRPVIMGIRSGCVMTKYLTALEAPPLSAGL